MSSSEAERIPVWILAGFLGSGKTSLLNSLLAGREGRRPGVIVNDFGQLGIDASLVLGQAEQLVELNGGQIFCSCLSGSFVSALATLATRPIHSILVESSGLAKPGPLAGIIDAAVSASDGRIRYAGMVTVVDAERFLRLRQMVNAVDEQILRSNLVVINKTDLVAVDQVREVTAIVKEMNPRAAVVATTHGHLLWSDLPDTGTDAHAKVPMPGGFAGWGRTGRPVTVTFTPDRVFSRDDVDALARELAPATLRIKGYLRAASGVWYVSASGDQLDVREIHRGSDAFPRIDGGDREQGAALTIIALPSQDIHSLLAPFAGAGDGGSRPA